MNPYENRLVLNYKQFFLSKATLQHQLRLVHKVSVLSQVNLF